MERKRRQRTVTWSVALVLVFVVGMLVGRQFCAEPPPEPPEPECPPPTEALTVEICPHLEYEEPEDQPDPPEPEEPEHRQLPDSPPPAEPDRRRQLLGWARDRSTTLEACPRDRGQTHRLGVTLELTDRAVTDVSISTEEGELSPGFEACVRERIGEWELPEDLPAPGRELFFHLTL